TPTAVAQRRRLRSAARSGRARMSRAVNKRTCVPDRDSGERVPTMRTKKTLSVALMLVACVAAFLILSGRTIVIGQAGTGSVAIDNDDIGGVVSGQNGPEAGVWVIAETRSTPTRLIKSVVTDDQGRYVVPDLPNVPFDVWVRGYGLVDSPKVKAT